MKQAMINYVKQEKFDDIFTPEYAVRPLLEYLPKNAIIWECCDNGNSKISMLLRKEGFKVISSGIKENFLKYEQKENFDIIITNPPYSLKDDFIERCYYWKKPFCLLLPITALEGKKRGKMFREHGIELLVLDKRINFTKKNIWFNTSWFCHKILPEKLIFEELEEC